jgi:hypothetical protein
MALTPDEIQVQETETAQEGYLHRSLVALDQFANVLLGGNPDETISSRSQRAAQRGDWRGKAMIWWLGKIQKNHGEDAQAGDIERATAVEDIEKKSLQ